MKSLNRVISKLVSEPWLTTPEQHQSMMQQLEMILTGKQSLLDTEDVETKEQVPSTIPTIGLIPMFGILGNHLSELEMSCGGCSLNQIQTLAKKYMSDDTISQVALYINSPGGTVQATPETYNVLKQLAAVKKLTAYTDGQMCSGALWLSCAASEVYASPTADVGSCGVYHMFLDATEAARMQGIKYKAISAGKYKLMGWSGKTMTEEEEAILQQEVDDIHTAFKNVVLSKAKNLQDREKSLNGMTYNGEKAANINLVDGVIETFEDYIAFIS
jgi:signal peptide peptidase SppA